MDQQSKYYFYEVSPTKKFGRDISLLTYQSQEQFDRGMALQLEDLQAKPAAAEPPRAPAPRSARMPFGYWISEDSFNRLERACSAALLLASVDERMAVPFDAVAFSAAYVHEDLATVVASAKHSSQLEARDDAA